MLPFYIGGIYAWSICSFQKGGHAPYAAIGCWPIRVYPLCGDTPQRPVRWCLPTTALARVCVPYIKKWLPRVTVRMNKGVPREACLARAEHIRGMGWFFVQTE